MHTKWTSAALTAAAACLSACTHPAAVSRPLTEIADKNAKFAIKDVSTGFTVEVRYSRYQFVPETGALITACRSLAIDRANEEAKKRGRAIESVNEQAIRVSTGRNIINARTSCRAFAEVHWKL